jgi:Transposase DDE domain/Insertion element 4 transposase N-terminal
VLHDPNSVPTRRPTVSQATRRWISEKVKSLRDSQLLPFHEILDAGMVDRVLRPEGVTSHRRIYTPLVTTCLVLSQVIDPDHSCRAAVARLIVGMAVNGRKPCEPDTSSYCEARQRLPEAVIARPVRETAGRTDARARDDWTWKGRSVILVDGTTASMPDTSANQRAYPQSKAQGIGLGFPLVRLVALISLATGVVRDLAMGPYQGKETGETALFRALWGGLEAGEVVLGDRAFGSDFGIAGLSGRGVDGLFRMHQRRKFDLRKGRCLGVEDHVVSWSRPERPDGMDEPT